MKRFLFLFIFLINREFAVCNCARTLYFREYDIRSSSLEKEFEVEDTYDIGCAIANYLLEKDATIETITLALDGRSIPPT